MIVDAILLLFQGILNVLLAPLSVLNIAIDFVSSIPVITSFLQVVAYVIPWSNILPLIILSIAIISFRTVFTLIRTVWNFIPFV
ncbi:MAG: hypothetical protein HFJ60_04635 [Clostridia bacterium]|jgi:hypothetical protein|nr:hypothetical protein [Clostridia bacterium]